ncbi:MAG TPA: dipeptide epimerase, partial [Cytophagaceae bacterium]
WKISRNESTFKTNYFIRVSNGKLEGIGEVAPNIRYNETPELIKAQFSQFINSGITESASPEEFSHNLSTLELCNSLRFGIESAFIHFHCAHADTPVYKFLGLNAPKNIATTYTLPIMEPEKIRDFIETYNLKRFKSLKIKVNKTTGLDMIKEVSRISNHPLMIDANEAWTDVDELLMFMEQIKNNNILFIEQPLPSSHKEEYKYLKSKSPFLLIADESITNEVNMEEISNQFHGVNMKLMKAGGYLNGLRILKEAQSHSLKTMIGCMVETTLGIASALHLAAGIDFIDLDGFFLIKDEPFRLVKEENGVLNLNEK